MRRDGDEVRTQLVDLHELPVEPRLLDREGSALRHHLQQLGLVRTEVTRREGANVEDAEHVSVSEQRHPEQRLDPFLAE